MATIETAPNADVVEMPVETVDQPAGEVLPAKKVEVVLSAEEETKGAKRAMICARDARETFELSSGAPRAEKPEEEPQPAAEETVEMKDDAKPEEPTEGQINDAARAEGDSEPAVVAAGDDAKPAEAAPEAANEDGKKTDVAEPAVVDADDAKPAEAAPEAAAPEDGKKTEAADPPADEPEAKKAKTA